MEEEDQKFLTIGTDVDLDTCKAEGYLMLDYSEDDLVDGTTTIKDKNTCFRVYAYAPDYCEEIKDEIIVDTEVSIDGLWEWYLENKEGVDSFIGMEHEKPTCIHSLLSLASDLNSYCGLE